MPLTATAILKSAFPNVVANAKGVVVDKSSYVPKYLGRNSKLVQRYPKMLGTQYLSVTATSTTTGSAPKRGPAVKHTVTVRGRTPDDQLYLGNVVVRCTCEFFTYTCEVALHKQGAATIAQSNGERPELTNPKMVPTPCKHLYAVLRDIVRFKVGRAT